MKRLFMLHRSTQRFLGDGERNLSRSRFFYDVALEQEKAQIGKMSDCKIAEPQVKEIEIPVPWGTIKGKWWGPENRQPYLAVHGWQDNCGSFDALASLLAPEISLLCIDLPGHGLSSKMPAGMTYYIFWDTMVVIRRIVKHFNWPKVSIIGHSLGGASGFLYAGAYPDEVDKLISIDIVCPRIAKPEVLLKQVPDCIDKFLKYEGLPESSQPSYEYAEMVQIAMDAHNGSLTKQSCQTMMKRGMLRSSTNPKNFTFTRDPRLKVAGLAMFSKDQVYAYAGKIRCDYLNIRARPGIKFELPEVYGELMDKIKTTARKFEYREVAGTHHVHMNEGSREEVANVIREFINGKKSFSKTENGVGESGVGEVGENGNIEQ